jgi:hypothetical protein
LGKHPLDHTACASPTRHKKYRQGSRTCGGKTASAPPSQCAPRSPRREGKPSRLMEPQGCSA